MSLPWLSPSLQGKNSVVGNGKTALEILGTHYPLSNIPEFASASKESLFSRSATWKPDYPTVICTSNPEGWPIGHLLKEQHRGTCPWHMGSWASSGIKIEFVLGWDVHMDAIKALWHDDLILEGGCGEHSQGVRKRLVLCCLILAQNCGLRLLRTQIWLICRRLDTTYFTL